MQSAGPDPLPSGGGAQRLGAAALLSGVAALVAQTLWIRALGRAVGTTSEALAAVTAVFMAGLGLGASWGGRLAARSADPAGAAARCLLGAGGLVVVSPWLFGLLPEGHLLLLDLLGLEPGPSPVPALLLALPLLLLPSLLMGASFPLLAAARRADAAHSGRGVGSLYALNTLGAALGVPAAVLCLPLLGERLTLSAAAALEVLAALALRGGTAGAPATPATSGERALRTPPALLAALMLGGTVGLGAEVAAFRLLEPLTGAHAWGLVLLLLPVLAGIALGAWIGGLAADRARDPRRALATALVVAGVLLAVSPAVAGLLPGQLLRLGHPDPALRILVLGAGATLVLLPPLAALGACLPLAARAAVGVGVPLGRAVGDLSGWNAAGSVLGSLAMGFVLLPSWGAPVALLAAAALALAAGPLLRLGRGGAPGLVVAALPLFALTLPAVRERLVAAAPALPEVVSVTAHRPPIVRRVAQEPYLLALESAEDARLYAEWFGGRPARRAGRAGARAEPVREGRLGTVALLEEPGGMVRVRVNGMSEARFDGDDPDLPSSTEVALGLLAVLAHPAPERALVVGHGAGWTAEAVLAAGPAHVDVAELDATVLEAVASWRGHPLAARSDPRARLHLTDGRLLLRLAAGRPERRYDVIASQPSHPWIPGAGHLFTREAYALAREALTERGVFAQWINLFEMSPDLLKRALATFRDVFPRCWLFLFEGEVVLLGFAGEARLDPARVERALDEDARVRRVAGPAGFASAGDLWRHFALDAAGLARLAPPREHPPVVDDRPVLELGLAWRVLTQAEEHAAVSASGDLAAEIRSHFPPDFAAALPEREARERWTALAADSWRRAGELEEARRWEAHGAWGGDRASRRARAALARARGEMHVAEQILRGLVAEEPGDAEMVVAWFELMAAGLAERPNFGPSAIADAAEPAARHASDGRVRAAQARVHQEAGDARTARLHYQAALMATAPPAPPGTASAFARLLIALGPEAGLPGPALPDRGPEGYALELLRGDPSALRERAPLELFARLERRLGDPERAKALEAAIDELDRVEARAARRAAWAWLPAGAPAGLAEAERAVWHGPSSVEGWELLALGRLQASVRSDEPAVRLAARAGAYEALAEAWRLSPDRPRQERRGEAYLRWFGAPPRGAGAEAPR